MWFVGLSQVFKYYRSGGLWSVQQAWWNQYRRLSKDYELLPETSESMIYTVMIRLLLKRLTQSKTDAS